MNDKIKQLPDDAEVITGDAPIRYAGITGADLKVLVSELETKTRALDLLDLVDVDDDGIFNIHRDGKLLGYGPTVKDALHSAIGFETALRGDENE